MRNWAHLKITCGNNKAQSLTELATFGTVLLLVLAFFIRYALQFNYQQDVRMRAFRMALAAAYTNYGQTNSDSQDTPHSSATIYLVEDKHIPDPQDRFGVGDINPIQAQQTIVWGNTIDLKGYDYDWYNLPKIQYVMNGDKHPYTTQNWRNIVSPVGRPAYAGGAFEDVNNNGVYDAGEPYPDPSGSSWICPAGVYVEFPNTETLTLVLWSDMRIYRPSSIATPPSSADTPQVWVLAVGTHTTELVNAVATAPTDVPAEITSITVPNKDIAETDPNSPFFVMQGDPISELQTLDSMAADINLNYDSLNADLNYDNKPEVTAQNLQGLRPDDNVQTVRDDTLSLEERSVGGGYYKSTGQVNTTATVTHKIGSNTGPIEWDYPIHISGGNTLWETPK